MATWINADGLAVDFGLDEANLGLVAGYRTDGDQRYIEIVADWSRMPAFGGSPVILDQKCKLPAGAVIERVEKAENGQDFTGTGAVLNIGLVDADDRASNADADGIVAAITLDEINEGWLVEPGNGDWAGSSIGVVQTQARLFTWDVDTASFTAGRTVFRVFYTIPKKTQGQDTLVYVKP